MPMVDTTAKFYPEKARVPQLNIKNPRTIEAARSLARATGESVTAAVGSALEEKLARIAPKPRFSEEEIARRTAAIKEIQREVRQAFEAAGERPPTKEEVDAMMYDEDGLPH